MRPSVRSVIQRFTDGFEGDVPHMYKDKAKPVGFVTVGRGNKIDPFTDLTAARIDWVRPDGSTPTPSEISSAWLRVKGAPPERCEEGGNSAYFQNLTSIRATPESLQRLFDRRLGINEAIIAEWFGDAWETFPAPAQLACHSMAWAGGPYIFHGYPSLTACCKAGNWAELDADGKVIGGAAAECHMKGWGIEARNAKNIALFVQAAAGGDPDAL